MTIDSFAASGNPEGPPGEVGRRLAAAFPDRILGLYLLGSRALGCALPASDLDLAIVFRGTVAPAERAAAQRLAAELRSGGPPVLELTVLDEAEARAGVRPHLKVGRLLAGDDVLRDCPLKPKDDLLGYFAYSALYFSWMIRGKPPVLPHPLAYPDPAGEFLGYERNGNWTGENAYRPGLGLLVNLAASIANFRLAQEAGEFVPNKSLTAAALRRRFPGAPLGRWVEEVLDLGRGRWQGAVPDDRADRERLTAACGQALAFENESVGRCIPLLPQFAASPDADLAQRMRGVLRVLRF